AMDPATGAFQGALLALSHRTDWPEHDNLAWLRERLGAFTYIDRVVVARDAQGLGIGRALYADLARLAASCGRPLLTCEVSTRPDNPASHRFHRKSGFQTLGDHSTPDGNKAVRYYAGHL
ncbi:MAG: GNAT family N-acetyltransferase, partial [Litorimonas sp.]